MYDGKIEAGMKFVWMQGTPGHADVTVTRVSHKIPGEPWVYARVDGALDQNTVGKEYGNEMDRFREAVQPAA